MFGLSEETREPHIQGEPSNRTSNHLEYESGLSCPALIFRLNSDQCCNWQAGVCWSRNTQPPTGEISAVLFSKNNRMKESSLCWPGLMKETQLWPCMCVSCVTVTICKSRNYNKKEDRPDTACCWLCFAFVTHELQACWQLCN